MAHPLDGIWLKVERSYHQLDALRTEMDRFLESHPYGVAGDFNTETRRLVAYLTIREPCPGVWGVLIGEMVHNLRSALDHLVWQLVIQNGETPVLANQFPICSDAGMFQRALDRQRLVHVSQLACDLIQSLQPYSTGEGINSPLWQLHEISNFDKHRTLHFAAAHLEGIQVSFPNMHPDIKVTEEMGRPPGPFEHGDVLVSYLVASPEYPFTKPIGEAQVQSNAAFGIAFDKRSPCVGGAVVIPTLRGAGMRTYEVFKRIAADIFGRTV